MGHEGLQADMDGEQRYTGQIYEERGRASLAMRGQLTYIGAGQKPGIIGSVGDGGIEGADQGRGLE